MWNDTTAVGLYSYTGKEQVPSDASSLSLAKYIYCHLCNPMAHYRYHNNPLGPLSQPDKSKPYIHTIFLLQSL